MLSDSTLGPHHLPTLTPQPTPGFLRTKTRPIHHPKLSKFQDSSPNPLLNCSASLQPTSSQNSGCHSPYPRPGLYLHQLPTRFSAAWTDLALPPTFSFFLVSHLQAPTPVPHLAYTQLGSAPHHTHIILSPPSTPSCPALLPLFVSPLHLKTTPTTQSPPLSSSLPRLPPPRSP